MVHRQIDLDEESDRMLTELAEEYDGDLGWALSELLQSRQGEESLGRALDSRRGDSVVFGKPNTATGMGGIQ